MEAHRYPSNRRAQVVLLKVMALAAVQGWERGMSPQGDLTECPYSRELFPELRRAWLEGFGIGWVSE